MDNEFLQSLTGIAPEWNPSMKTLLEGFAKKKQLRSPDLPAPPQGTPVNIDLNPQPEAMPKQKGFGFLVDSLTGALKQSAQGAPKLKQPIASGFSTPYGLTFEQGQQLRNEISNKNLASNEQAMAQYKMQQEDEARKIEQQTRQTELDLLQNDQKLRKVQLERELSQPSAIEIEIWKANMERLMRGEQLESEMLLNLLDITSKIDPETRQLTHDSIKANIAQSNASASASRAAAANYAYERTLSESRAAQEAEDRKHELEMREIEKAIAVAEQQAAEWNVQNLGKLSIEQAALYADELATKLFTPDALGNSAPPVARVKSYRTASVITGIPIKNFLDADPESKEFLDQLDKDIKNNSSSTSIKSTTTSGTSGDW